MSKQVANPEDKPLTPKEEAFVREYLIDLNGTQAVLRAGYRQTNGAARTTAVRLLAKANVTKALRNRIGDRNKRLDMEADDVIRRLAAIATADVRELVEYRRRCCRHCYGLEHRYQETPVEQGERKREWLAASLMQKAETPVAPFDERGGAGFDRTLMPNPECPECRGEGVGRIHINDTGNLSPAALALYQGVQIGKDGIRVLTAGQDAALKALGEHFGLFKQKLEVTGKDGGPIQTEKTLTDAELEAIARGSG
jgi:phage terminase small subunit